MKNTGYLQKNEWKNHHFAASVVVTGSGQNLLHAKTTGKGLLGGEDFYLVSEDHPTACLVISEGEKVPLQMERAHEYHFNQVITDLASPIIGQIHILCSWCDACVIYVNLILTMKSERLSGKPTSHFSAE